MAREITNPERHIVAAAFRQMARGIQPKAAFASTVEYYRESGREWTKRLG